MKFSTKSLECLFLYPFNSRTTVTILWCLPTIYQRQIVRLGSFLSFCLLLLVFLLTFFGFSYTQNCHFLLQNNTFFFHVLVFPIAHSSTLFFVSSYIMFCISNVSSPLYSTYCLSLFVRSHFTSCLRFINFVPYNMVEDESGFRNTLTVIVLRLYKRQKTQSRRWSCR